MYVDRTHWFVLLHVCLKVLGYTRTSAVEWEWTVHKKMNQKDVDRTFVDVVLCPFSTFNMIVRVTSYEHAHACGPYKKKV